MKRFWMLCLVLVIVLSFGCSKKEETGRTDVAGKSEQKMKPSVDRPEVKSLKRSKPHIDPVSKEPITKADSLYSYKYDNWTYHFKSSENLETFKKDPEKYVREMK